MTTSFEIAEKNFREDYQRNKDSNKSKLDKIESLIKELILKKFPDSVITCRIKNENECVSKFKRKYLEDLEKKGEEYTIKEKITDILGLRIVCLYEKYIDDIVQLLKKEFDVINETNKTKKLEESPDSFGYKGHHLDLQLTQQRLSLAEYEFLNGVKFEVQVRTTIQDAWSTLDHKIKYKKQIPNDLKRQINALAALFEIADREFTQIKEKTESYERQIPLQQENIEGSKEDLITAFAFLSIMKEHFPSYSFTENYKIDELAEKLSNEKIAIDEVKAAFGNSQQIVINYKKEKDISMNPFTEFRHIMYHHNQEKNKHFLFDYQRESFDSWLSTHKNTF